MCVFANATNCRGALIRSFIHSFSHSFRSRSLVSQSVRQARQSFSRCQNCHAPRPRSTFARLGPSSVSRALDSQPASQLLGSQSGQSTFSIDVARLRTHIASRTKQSPVSNSVRHSLTESCLPFISICQSGQQAGQRAPAPKIPQQHQLWLLLLLLRALFFCFLLYIVSYALFYLQHCVLAGRGGEGEWKVRQRDWHFFDARSCKDSMGPLKPLRFQFISRIFSFQIHIFLTKVLRFLRDFCLFVIPSLSFTHSVAFRC